MPAEAPQTSCMPCLEGMTCPEASNFSSWLRVSNNAWNAIRQIPVVERGYMTIASLPRLVYRCREPADCPGGLPGTCGMFRDPTKVACGSCID
eukprot:2478365-Amphidinium_carterae.1